MTLLSEGTHAGEFIVSEASRTRSRDSITVLTGQVLAAAAVLGAVTLGAAAVAADGGNTGDGVLAMAATPLGPDAQVGDYLVTCITAPSGAAANDAVFSVFAPDGSRLADATQGVAYAVDHINFTIGDVVGVDFAAGDLITVSVAEGSGKFKEWNPGNADGSQVARAVLFEAVDATDADMPGVAITRDAEVNAAELQWFDGATDNQKAAGLAQLDEAGIIGR